MVNVQNKFEYLAIGGWGSREGHIIMFCTLAMQLVAAISPEISASSGPGVKEGGYRHPPPHGSKVFKMVHN